MSDLSKNEIYEGKIRYRAYIDLYKMAKSSFVAYPVLFWVITCSSSIIREHFSSIVVLGIIITIISFLRLFVSVKSKKYYRKKTVFYQKLFFYLTLITGFLWGIFCLVTLSFYGVSNQVSVFVLIVSCGLAGGSVVTLAPDIKLLKLYIATMLFPVAVWGGITGNWPITGMFLLYFGIISAVCKNSSGAYSENQLGKLLLKEKKDLMEDVIADINVKTQLLEKTSENLNTISSDIHGSAEATLSVSSDLAESSEEMNKNNNKIFESMNDSVDKMDMTSKSMEELLLTITGISEKAGTALEITNEAVTQVNSASERTDKLTDAADEIGNISAVITEISSQTNLLALNATIEATRAGVAGKGFAVVANEIKQLAQQTKSATDGIKNQVEGIQNAIAESASEMKMIAKIIMDLHDIVNGVSDDVENQSGTTRDVYDVITQISGGVTSVNDMLNSNMTNTEKITAGISNVSEKSKMNSELSANVQDSAEEILGTSREMAELTGLLEASV